MNLNLAAPLRTALLANGPLVDLLGLFDNEPSIHTRRPVPSAAGSPLILVSPDVSISDRDGLKSRQPVAQRDISIYGDQPDGYRAVETAGYLVREMFHRQPQALVVDGYQVVQIVASGPSEGPTDDETTVCRYVSLMIHLRQLV